MLDEAFGKFVGLKEQFLADLENVETEQDVRIGIIDRMLVDVLGWELAEVKTERKAVDGYSDYLISAAGKTRAVVEAKRTSEKLSSSKASRVSFLQLGGPGLNSAKDGIEQATRYCIDEGVELAVLTNGITWIGFRATRSDGRRPSEGKAIVFSDLTIVEKQFSTFFDMFGRENVLDKVYRAVLLEAEGVTLSPKEELSYAFEAATIRVDLKSQNSRNLEEVFDAFFSAISGEEDKTLLINCFVESKESEHAERELSKIASEVLQNLRPMDSSAGQQLATEIEIATRAKRGEKVLLIGNKGAGKSTFVERFFEVSLDASTRSKCVYLKIDLATFSGNEAGLADWLDRTLQRRIDEKLYEGEPPSYDELQGVFHNVYQKWSTGAHKHLHDKDLTAFKIKFGEYLQDVIDHHAHEYCLSQLINIVRSRELLPCVVFDNTDQFPLSIQQAVFQYANALYENVKACFLIVPITDHTVWQLSKSGPLQSYQAKSFFLPVPSTKQVLEKRINYLSTEVERRKSAAANYVMPNGIHVSLNDLNAFVSCLEEVFLKNDYIARRIGYLSNFDIRRSLELSKRLMTSHFIGIDRLISAFINKDDIRVSRTNITLGLVNGNHEKFRQDQSSFVLNLFEVDPTRIGSPLLRLRLLFLFLDKHRSVHDLLESYLTCSEVEDYFESMGVPADLTRANIHALIESRLLEPYDPTDLSVRPGQRVSITHSGEMHVEMAMHDLIYFSQMALVTGVRSHDVALDIRDKFNSQAPMYAKIEDIKTKFLDYCIRQDHVFVRVPALNEIFKSQRALIDELQASRSVSGTRVKVEWFNPSQGYGFVGVAGESYSAYLSLTVVEEFGLDRLDEGTELVCEVAKSIRGYHVAKIESIVREATNTRTAQTTGPKDLQIATVVFYNPSKGYGFLKPASGGQDILLNRRVLNSIGISEIEEGLEVLVEFEMHIKGPVATAIQVE
ncbi:hypothetical protein [Thalassospira sp.]|uniref:hypothetical protein n=1 Tax=Thalassospira sp. TaxID=1912094 RepID=UPI002E8CBBA2|nr:hypothetical protein [Pseudomonadota bacterium]